MQNEFGIISGIITLVCLCVYPDDIAKRVEMAGVFNVTILHAVKYGKNGMFGDLIESKSIEEDIVRFGQGAGFTITSELLKLPPQKLEEIIKNAAVKVATDNLELPEDIERFLLSADKPEAFREDLRIAVKGLAICTLIIMKLMQMSRLGTELRGDASLNKAIELLADARSASSVKSETNIRKAWKRYGRSTHVAVGLALAYALVRTTDLIKNENKDKGYIDDLISPSSIGSAIVLTKLLQDWLLEFKLSKHATTSSGTKLIKPNHLWLLSEKIQKPQNLRIESLIESLPPLNDWELQVLKQKRRMQVPEKLAKTK
jgi:hypothetical protein